MTVEQHELHEQSVGAYLLGALDDGEAANFERHLEQCHLCRDEVERLRPAVMPCRARSPRWRRPRA